MVSVKTVYVAEIGRASAKDIMLIIQGRDDDISQGPNNYYLSNINDTCATR